MTLRGVMGEWKWKTVQAVCLILLLSGCSVVTALRQPEKKNLSILMAGMSRENIVAHLGAPAVTDTEGDTRTDLYKFRQGYSGTTKATRATLHTFMDVLTLCIWELVAWPAEAIFNGEETTVKVIYDSSDKLKTFSFLEKTNG